MPIAPLGFLVAEGAALEVPVADFEVPVPVVMEVLDVKPAVNVAPARGAVVCPAFCDETAAENCPVMPIRLFRIPLNVCKQLKLQNKSYVNREEKAW